jgi:hypothetical protein
MKQIYYYKFFRPVYGTTIIIESTIEVEQFSSLVEQFSNLKGTMEGIYEYVEEFIEWVQKKHTDDTVFQLPTCEKTFTLTNFIK